MFSITPDFLLVAGFMLIQMIFLYIITRYNSGNAEKQFDTKMASAIKKQQKSIADLSETVKHLGYDIRWGREK